MRGVRRVRLRATGAVQDGIVGRNRTLLIDFYRSSTTARSGEQHDGLLQVAGGEAQEGGACEGRLGHQSSVRKSMPYCEHHAMCCSAVVGSVES